MLTLSKLSDYAIVLMTFLATHDQYKTSAQTLSRATQIPAPTVVKLLKLLTTGGELQSIQGRGGGYQLSRMPSEISVIEIIETIDGTVAITECNREEGNCRIQDNCLVRRHWLVINQALREALTSISLADLASPGLRINGTWHSDHIGHYADLPKWRCLPERNHQ